MFCMKISNIEAVSIIRISYCEKMELVYQGKSINQTDTSPSVCLQVESENREKFDIETLQ